MLLQLQGIGNQKIKYKDHTKIEFDSLEQYLTLAKKIISKFANGFYQGLASKMLNDEDAISSIANSIMMADWRWDQDYKNKQGTKKNKYSYRNQCALWAIQTYITKNKKTNDVYSLDYYIDNETTLSSYTPDHKSQSPDNIVEEKENKEILSSLVNELLSLEFLTDRQKDYLRLYYMEGYTFEKIGKKYGITREAVRQGLNKTVELIKGYVKNEYN